MLNRNPAFSYPLFKLAILALLTINVFVYAIVDTWTSTVDATTWLILLVMYELESWNGQGPFTEKMLHAIRNILIAIIALVFFSYLHDSEWLDVINSLLWFALIALLELEVRWPNKVRKYSRTFWLATIGVFMGVISMVPVWLWQSEWLDAYDAALWIAAFAMIEVDIFQFLQSKDR
ncbi:MAG: hypothetical protein ACXV7J_12365 [Methylomonas sp.]